jgi:hypothetical protein
MIASLRSLRRGSLSDIGPPHPGLAALHPPLARCAFAGKTTAVRLASMRMRVYVHGQCPSDERSIAAHEGAPCDETSHLGPGTTPTVQMPLPHAQRHAHVAATCTSNDPHIGAQAENGASSRGWGIRCDTQRAGMSLVQVRGRKVRSGEPHCRWCDLSPITPRCVREQYRGSIKKLGDPSSGHWVDIDRLDAACWTWVLACDRVLRPLCDEVEKNGCEKIEPT